MEEIIRIKIIYSDFECCFANECRCTFMLSIIVFFVAPIKWRCDRIYIEEQDVTLYAFYMFAAEPSNLTQYLCCCV